MKLKILISELALDLDQPLNQSTWSVGGEQDGSEVSDRSLKAASNGRFYSICSCTVRVNVHVLILINPILQNRT